MRILFITRKFPPQTGGMEKFSVDFYQAFKNDCTLLALGLSQIHLIWWLPYAVLRGWWLARTVDVIHLGDGVLAWVGVVLHWLTKKPISITLHGLDVTYTKYGYQKIIWLALKYYQAIVCVSSHTQRVVETHCNASLRPNVYVIPNGITMADWNIPRTRPEPNDTIMLLTVGRLVPRKGVAWFVEHVMSQLPSNYSYTIIGTGPEQDHITAVIAAQHLADRVKLLGYVNNEVLKQWYGTADYFIMPNIHIDNDTEGFGIVAVEAAATGLPTVAANLEGLRDAVIDGQTGFLVKSGQPETWIKRLRGVESQITQINSLMPLMNATSIKQAVQDKFSWEKIKQDYLKVFNKLLK